MAFDEGLAHRIRDFFEGSDSEAQEKKMFGGLAFMVHGHMCVGIVDAMLMVRIGPQKYETLLGQPYAKPMTFTGRPMKGMLYVDPEGIDDDDQLAFWIQEALDFVDTLPPKS